MNPEATSAPEKADPAAVFASAMSLWSACQKCAEREHLNLSEIHNGMDQLMRLAMRIGDQFETWAGTHIDFKEISDVWPHLLEEKFGEACMDSIALQDLTFFDDRDCLRVAMRLQLPVILDGKLPVPVDVIAPNPEPNSPFKKYRIQTVRDSEDGDVVVYTFADDPFDTDFGEPFFGLYGVFEDGTVEHIADRDTFSEAIALAKKIVPGLEFSAI